MTSFKVSNTLKLTQLPFGGPYADFYNLNAMFFGISSFN